MSMFKDVYKIYKIGHDLKMKKIPFLPQCISAIKRVIFPACDIPITADIGEGTRFPHRGIGVVINGKSVIGRNCKIESNVTIGGKSGDPNVPVIGNDVFIGTGATIVGG